MRHFMLMWIIGVSFFLVKNFSINLKENFTPKRNQQLLSQGSLELNHALHMFDADTDGKGLYP